MSLKIKGINDISSKLDQLSRGISNIPKNQSVSVSKLLDNEFMQANTQFTSLTEMEQSFKNLTGKEPNKGTLETEQWNQFISNHTNFKSWNDLIAAAGKGHIIKQVSNVFKKI